MAQSMDNLVEVLQQGGVIAYPTETVWGLGCDPWNREAVQRILDIKRRPVEKGLILIAASEDQIQPLLEPLSQSQRDTLSASWPGPNTWLLPDPDKWTPDWVRGNFSSVAVRVSSHPLVAELCNKAGHPLISTSANRAGEDPLQTFEQVQEQMGDELDLIVPGETGPSNNPSRICDLLTGEVIRAG